MKFLTDKKGFSLIEAVVALSVLGVGIVAVFTIYHTIIMVQKASGDIFDQGLNLNSVVNEIRTGVPEGLPEEALRQQVEAIASRHKGWQAELQPGAGPAGLYELRLTYHADGGKKKVFYAKMVYA